jgi:hypothetical protein
LLVYYAKIIDENSTTKKYTDTDYDVLQMELSMLLTETHLSQGTLTDIPLWLLISACPIYIFILYQVKSYFVFYILFHFKPYINYKLVKFQDKNYSLKFQISNKNKIYAFIHFFFFNFFSNKFFNFFFNVKNFDLKNLSKIEKIQNSSYKNLFAFSDVSDNNDVKLNKRNLIFKMPIFCFYELDSYINSMFDTINLKDIFLYINLIIDSPQNFSLRTLKNYPCFWIFHSYKKKLQLKD